MSLLGIGSQVIIRQIRSGNNERFWAGVTSVDEATGRAYVTKFNANKGNRAGPTTEHIAKALRVDDGKPPETGEDYVIEKVVSLSAQMADDITAACRETQALRESLDALKKDMLERNAAQDARLHAVITTLLQWAGPDAVEAVNKAMNAGVVVTAPPIERPAPKKAEPVQDAEGFDASPVATAVETRKRK